MCLCVVYCAMLYGLPVGVVLFVCASLVMYCDVGRFVAVVCVMFVLVCCCCLMCV